jgi:hypothetical protein
MALTVIEIEELREYINGVMERADHHAGNVKEIALALASAIPGIAHRWPWMGLVWLSLILSFHCLCSSPAGATDLPLIDAHSQIDDGVDMDRVLALMEEAKITRAILSSLRGFRKNPQIIAAATRHPDRITPSIGLKSGAFRSSDPAAIAAVGQMAQRPEFGAISEVMVLHQRKGNVAPEIVTSLNAPQVGVALSAALSRHWPLVIHIEFGFARARGIYRKYMDEFEQFLDAHPDLPVALSHMGQLTATEAGRLITAHRNVYFLTAHTNPIDLDAKGHGLPWSNLFDGESLAVEWKDVIQRHADRFILAFDNVLDDDWNDRYPRQARLWRTALEALPSDVAKSVAHGNAERLWHLSVTKGQGSAPRTPATPQSGAEIVGPFGLTARQVLDKFDDDRDGRMNRTEFRRPPQIFDPIDSDHDGYITPAELDAAWRSMRDK